MKCGQCQQPIQLHDLRPEAFVINMQTRRGVSMRVHFCSLACCFWGGAKFVQRGAPTTAAEFRKLYPGAVL